jgi:hypothetical protein
MIYAPTVVLHPDDKFRSLAGPPDTNLDHEIRHAVLFALDQLPKLISILSKWENTYGSPSECQAARTSAINEFNKSNEEFRNWEQQQEYPRGTMRRPKREPMIDYMPGDPRYEVKEEEMAKYPPRPEPDVERWRNEHNKAIAPLLHIMRLRRQIRRMGGQ